MKSAIIIGGDSTIGSALANHLQRLNIHVTKTNKRSTSGALYLDLAATPENWPTFPIADVAYLCAAITKLDQCEQAPEATAMVNVAHMQHLITRLQEQGSFVVFLSTNQVFDGKKSYYHTTDTPTPMNEYGRQKAAMEKWLRQQTHPSAILRLSKVISAPLPLLATWETTLRAGKPIDVFDDLVFAPLPLSCVLSGLTFIGQEKKAGIHHLSGTHDLSYYDIACLLADKIGASKELIHPISATSKNIPENFLPKHGTLANSFGDDIVIPDAERVIFS